jgi:hypothetical protein
VCALTRDVQVPKARADQVGQERAANLDPNMHVEQREPLEGVELAAIGAELVARAVADADQPGCVGAVEREIAQHTVPRRRHVCGILSTFPVKGRTGNFMEKAG